MKDIEKLRVMLPHWIDHNQGHGGEFAQWAEKLADDSPEVVALLREAVQSLEKAQRSLEEALEKAGGPLEMPEGGVVHNHTHDQKHHHSHS
ncbi:MAG: hypothetical protein D3918_05635 [Candidatus Electrothrix sp. AX2]|nr:hypothetical protein [Candidatus Electrothrix gigas]